jgi:hypothetical protein
MSTYSNLPGSLNLSVKSGSTFGIVLTFAGQTLTSYTATTVISSLVTGRTVADIATSILDATRVSLSLPKESTALLSKGSYQWSHTWTQPGGVSKPVLSGVIDVS